MKPVSSEPLEVRRLFAGIVVNSALDDATPGDGLTTLREAIALANTDGAPDVITFAPAVHTISLGQALPDLSTDIDIQGPGAGSLTVRRDGAATFAIFTVATGAAAAVSGITVTNGAGEQGGGIRNQGTLTLSQSAVVGNRAFRDGGGIFNDEGGVLTVLDSTIAGNEANGGGGGGGVFSASGMVTVTGSTIDENKASSSGGGVFIASGTLAVRGSSVSGNAAEYWGGGIYSNGAVELSDSTVSDNATTHFSGGGIYSSSGTLAVRDSTLSGNYAGGHDGGGDGGGAIYNEVGTALLERSTLSANTAFNVGGAIYNGFRGDFTVRDSLVTGNSSPGGAGITNKATLTVERSTVSHNTAFMPDPFSGGAAGGIYNSSSFFGEVPTCMISNSTVSDNHAEQGGGLHNTGGAVLTLDATTVSGNSGGVGGGGGIYNSSTLTIRNSTLSGNTAASAGGLQTSGQAVVQNSTISGNTGESIGGIYNSGSLDLSHSTVSGNTSTYQGGGIFNHGTVTLNHSIVAGNTSSDSPGEADLGGGSLVEGAYNFIGTDHPRVDPRLGPLADNGGPTLTIALLPGSPAMNAGDPAFVGPPDSDQRGAGFDRVLFGRVDIGAFESQVQAPADRVNNLLARVAQLTADAVLSHGQATALLKPLEQALHKLSQDSPSEAATQLQNFVQKVEKQIKSLNPASPDYAADLAALTELKTEAQAIIELLLRP